jgi:hypothetical protein
MRQTISGLIAAIAVFTAAPAMACGGLFDGGCSPCGSPCAQTYAPAYTYTGCNTGCGGYAAYERLPDPEVQYHAAPTAMPQYYYVDQGPTYTGPGDLAPRRVYREGGVYGWGVHHHRWNHYGYEGRWYPHRHFHPWHHYAAPYRYGYHYRPHVLHSYY